MIQADCIILEKSVIVSLHHGVRQEGRVMMLSLNLETIKWAVDMPEGVTLTPIQQGEDLWVSCEAKVVAIKQTTGEQIWAVELPSATFCQPALTKNGTVLYAADESLVCVDSITQNPPLVQPTSVAIGPVYKDPLTTNDKSYISDSWGTLHRLDTDNDTTTTAVSNFPLSGAARLHGDCRFVVGSYDGFVYCLNGMEICWKVHVGGVVYAKPLVDSSGKTLVVTTTAGDIVLLRDDNDKPTIVLRHRLSAEIWSDPTWVDETDHIIAVGARDSKVHIVTLTSS
jgi:outer membrane protein assembly factor BamB